MTIITPATIAMIMLVLLPPCFSPPPPPRWRPPSPGALALDIFRKRSVCRPAPTAAPTRLVPFSFLCIFVVPRSRRAGAGGGGGGVAWGSFAVPPVASRTIVPQASHFTVEPPERSVTSIFSWQRGHFSILAMGLLSLPELVELNLADVRRLRVWELLDDLLEDRDRIGGVARVHVRRS